MTNEIADCTLSRQLIWIVSALAIASVAVGCKTAGGQTAGTGDDAATAEARAEGGAVVPQPVSTEEAGRPTIRVTLSEIRYRGEMIRTLEDGRLGEETWLIRELYTEMAPLQQRQGALDILAKEDWPLVRVDEWVPYETLLAVVVTSSRSGRARLSLSIGGREPFPIAAPEYGATLPEGAFDTRDGKLDLVVSVLESGFRLYAAGAVLPAEGDCPSGGPTICQAHVREPGVLTDNGRQAVIAGEPATAADAFSRLRKGYNWSALSEKLKSLNERANANDMWRDDIVTVSMAEDLPVGLLTDFHDANCDRAGRACYFNRLVLGPAQ